MNKRKNDTKELDFQKYFIANTDSVLKRAQFIGKEYSLYPTITLLKREFYQRDVYGNRIAEGRPFGRIDLLFRYKSKNYACEIKYRKSGTGELFDALKVLGYATYYNYQAETTGSDFRVKPAIMMPNNHIKLEHVIICTRLDITLFGIEENDGEYKLIPKNLG